MMSVEMVTPRPADSAARDTPPAPTRGAASAPSGRAPASQTSVYFRFQDAQGREHIVDSLDEVPEAYRSRAVRIELAPGSESQHPTSSFSVSSIDARSCSVGLGAALVLGLLVLCMRRGRRLLLKLAFLAAAVVALATAYFGWLRRETGQGQSLLAAPSALIDDARHAVDKMNQRTKQQEQMLREIEKQAK